MTYSRIHFGAFYNYFWRSVILEIEYIYFKKTEVLNLLEEVLKLIGVIRKKFEVVSKKIGAFLIMKDQALNKEFNAFKKK